MLVTHILTNHAKGSSAIAPFYSLQGLISTVQIFALILSTIGKTFQAFENLC